jgi:hypothetical protein
MKKEKNTYNQIFGYEKWPFCVNSTIWRRTDQKEVEEGKEEKKSNTYSIVWPHKAAIRSHQGKTKKWRKNKWNRARSQDDLDVNQTNVIAKDGKG